ncbi:MAG: ABC transporter ATP-binding protein [Rhodospirillales bacterium]|nr:ABC transporter ATP-binding protein [Rhodospirillales bacterium]
MDGMDGPRAAARAETGAGIGFAGVTVAYGGAVALADFTLDVRRGEILALIGPSGSGKTTALRALAGFALPVAGRVTIAGRDVTGLAPAARGIGMVVQSYALFPHMRVAENVAFGLAARGVAKAEQRARALACLRLVGVEGLAERLPRQLSGGQQQRVAIARALAIRPEVLLLDEPFSALDAQIRRAMVEEVGRLHAAMPELTILHVTHDQTEALSLAHRIGILRGGRLEAAGESRALYQTPPTRFAAEFLGRANLLPVEVLGVENGAAMVRFGTAVLRARGGAGRGRRLLCVRPHALRLHQAENGFAARVDGVRWQGETHALDLVAGDTRVHLTSSALREPPRPGTMVTVGFDPADAPLLDDA